MFKFTTVAIILFCSVLGLLSYIGEGKFAITLLTEIVSVSVIALVGCLGFMSWYKRNF